MIINENDGLELRTMKFHILTLFPDMVMQGLNTSIIGRAAEKKLLEINTVNIRDYTTDKHGKVDDYPYGGGAGMLIQAQPVYDAYQSVTCGKKIRTIYVTPQGTTFHQKLAQELAEEKELVFLCGHYEGIDERVLEEVVTDYISIGEYVLTGGELPAMVMIDAISRLIPGVLNNDSSAETESFHNDLLEYPQYSRPDEWHGKGVPQVLLSGNHSLITKWRLEQSKERTKERRPDLYQKYLKKEQTVKRLSKHKRNHIHIMETLSRGIGDLLYSEGDNVLVYNSQCKIGMLTVKNRENGERLLELLPRDIRFLVVSQEFMKDAVCEKLGYQVYDHCYLSCYTKKEALPVKHKDIRLLTVDDLEYVMTHYRDDEAYLRRHLERKAMYGAYVKERLVGFVGTHEDGSSGFLFVEKEFRRMGIGESLEAYIINREREMGWTSYGYVVVGNEASLHVQESLGLYLSQETVWWTGPVVCPDR